MTAVVLGKMAIVLRTTAVAPCMTAIIVRIIILIPNMIAPVLTPVPVLTQAQVLAPSTTAVILNTMAVVLLPFGLTH